MKICPIAAVMLSIRNACRIDNVVDVIDVFDVFDIDDGEVTEKGLEMSKSCNPFANWPDQMDTGSKNT
eukprot:CAMPEP_0203704472 /NCGR_PEP_ID=MMETSP0091-20130426/46705_1 /ASSEMBLY_ACC=CAM_ASM_001089 /TAXON_ID=426623 /ORGANISM="Chaetoceros affinis, Strain CCMP159" /LENGTH=67 /DNA_ID=CAMNT_0050579513 /DNA_START=254 /DNA_END=454 /DNA_ORIENTATION=+